jgi:release factor glutamine methyltransferase
VPTIVERLRAAGCVFADEEASLIAGAASTPDELEEMVARRVEGLPLEQVVGFAEFCGRRILVDPGVFVPRHRTEFLVREAAALARPGCVIVDLCCGTGALGLALAAMVEGAALCASDIEPAAVACARRNVGPTVPVYQGDLFSPLPTSLHGRVDILLANTPYVPTGEIAFLPAEARLYEPAVTLDGGVDGLDLQRRIAAEALEWLAPGGHVLAEVSERQAQVAHDIFASAGLATRIATSDELYATVVIGTRRQPPRRTEPTDNL